MMHSPKPAGGDWVVTSETSMPGSTLLAFAHVDDEDHLTWVTVPDDATGFLTQAEAVALTRTCRRGGWGRPRLRVRRLEEARQLRRVTAAANECAFTTIRR